VRQIVNQLAERQSDQFSANTQTNSKEHYNSITTRSSIVVGEGIGDYLVVEQVRKDEKEKEKNKNEEEK